MHTNNKLTAAAVLVRVVGTCFYVFLLEKFSTTIRSTCCCRALHMIRSSGSHTSYPCCDQQPTWSPLIRAVEFSTLPCTTVSKPTENGKPKLICGDAGFGDTVDMGESGRISQYNYASQANSKLVFSCTTHDGTQQSTQHRLGRSFDLRQRCDLRVLLWSKQRFSGQRNLVIVQALWPQG